MHFLQRNMLFVSFYAKKPRISKIVIPFFRNPPKAGSLLCGFLLLFFFTSLNAQGYILKGRVTDSGTNRPLAFVNIAVKDTRFGCTTDIDGRFLLKTVRKPAIIQLSYLGYEPMEYRVEDLEEFQVIKMKVSPLDLEEVEVYPGRNPALRLIDSVLANRKINDPERLSSFTYDSYNKFFVTAYRSTGEKPGLSITDTVDFQSLKSGNGTLKGDSGTIRPPIPLNRINPDSATIASFLQDTSLVHPLLRNFLADSSNLLNVKIGLQFVKDNPALFNDFNSGLKNILPSPGQEINAMKNPEQWLSLSDSLLHEPAVLRFLVPAIDSVLADTAMMSKLIEATGLDTLLADRFEGDTLEFDDDDFSFDRQNLFLMESVTRRLFRKPDLSRETVIATRTSGLQDPLFILLATQIQSFSFYKEVIKIVQKNYINPVSRGSASKYFFHIEDTVLYAGSRDTIFIISFQPKRNTNFEGLKGVLYINTNTWAIQNVIAATARDDEAIGIKIQQQYTFVEGRQWFPEQLNTEVTLSQNSVVTMSEDNVRWFPIGIGRTYIKNVELEPGIRRSEFDAVAVEVEQKATKRDSTFWNAYRSVALTDKDRETYRYLDSLGREYNFDKYSRQFFIWKSGYLPVKFLNINLGNILMYNQYEGLRTQLDIRTNQNLSTWLTLGGYLAYGTTDKRFKGGGSASVSLFNRFEPSLGVSYKRDIVAYGVEDITFDLSWFSDQYLRRFLIREMAPVEDIQADFKFRVFRYQKWDIALHRLSYESVAPFLSSYSNAGDPERGIFTEASATLRFAYKEKLIKTMQQELLQSLNRESIRTRYPVLWVRYSRGLQGVLNGGYTYNRLDARIEKSFFIKYMGTANIIIEGGMIDRDLPYARLFNANASYRPFTIEAPNSFGTMRMNEFVSDRYISVFFMHNFGRLLIRTKHFQPEFNFITNAGIGERSALTTNESQDWAKTMDKGYYESGIMIQELVNLKILKIGFGVYYRYGPYGFSSPKENFAYKFSLHGPF